LHRYLWCFLLAPSVQMDRSPPSDRQWAAPWIPPAPRLRYLPADPSVPLHLCLWTARSVQSDLEIRDPFLPLALLRLGVRELDRTAPGMALKAHVDYTRTSLLAIVREDVGCSIPVGGRIRLPGSGDIREIDGRHTPGNDTGLTIALEPNLITRGDSRRSCLRHGGKARREEHTHRPNGQRRGSRRTRDTRPSCGSC